MRIFFFLRIFFLNIFIRSFKTILHDACGKACYLKTTLVHLVFEANPELTFFFKLGTLWPEEKDNIT